MLQLYPWPLSASVMLWPNPAFPPKSITSSFRSRVLTLNGFSLSPYNSEKEAQSHLLCPVRELSCYVRCTAALHKSECLFVLFKEQSQGQPLSTQRLAISQAYSSAGLHPPDGIRAHSTRGISTSTALHRGVSTQDICSAPFWESSTPFIRF